MSVILGKSELGRLSMQLCGIEDWLRDSCSARHAEDMADVIHEAWQVIDDLSDGE